jgi:DNA-3-methyladenine glycosylase I
MKNLKRCTWPGEDALMIDYHDNEWGRPVHSDKQHFEFLILEAAQAGLSWRTVLYKRKGYKKAFANFDPKKVAKFNKQKINSLIKNPEIIRNRLKIEAAVNNAKRFLEVQKEFGTFDKYIWQFVNNKPIVNNCKTNKDIRATSPESDALSKDLKVRGFKFVGSTVIYAHMQAVGMVNDHLTSCFCFKKLSKKGA